MDFKSLFIVSDENPDDKPENKKVETKTKFPTTETTTSFPTTEEPTSGNTMTNIFGFGSTPAPKVETFTPSYTQSQGATPEQIEKAQGLYAQGFEALNQPGYDFYEFYQAILGADAVNNPPMYKMALSMAVAMEKSITKEKLSSQSDFYITEIDKIYQNYSSQGNDKRENVIAEKNHETQALSGELDLMHQQLEALKTQIADRENKLSVIDSKYGPKITEIEGKLRANEIAKNALIGSLQAVKNGIQTNL